MAAKKKTDKLTISIPRNGLTDRELENLRAIVKTKQSLIKKAFGADSLEIVADEQTINFPWFPSDSEENVNLYIFFITSLCNLARKLIRVNAKEEKTVDNEKYAFRCFLLRLGMIGEQYKNTRKLLLKNFTGSSAFRQAKESTL